VRPLFTLIAAAGIAGIAHYGIRGHGISRATAALADANGFIPAQMPDGAERGSVLILAPLHCPREGAKRARALAQRMKELGIPAVESDRYSVAQVTPDNKASIDRAVEVLKTDTLPVVFINGRAKANPTADEVADEYRRN
jgi:hypothetical protein